MAKREFLSICIPTYNRAQYLNKAIESCIYAINKYDVRVYIQDNASLDNTKEIVKKYVNERIIYECNEKNMGAIYNVNKLLKKAEGEYIFFLTDDDYFLVDGITKVYNFLKTYEPDFLSTDMIAYLEKSRESFVIKSLNKTGIAAEHEIVSIYLNANVLTRCCFKKDSLSGWQKNLQGENVYPHCVALMDLIVNNKKIAYLAEPVVLHTWENEIFWEKDFNRQVGVKYCDLAKDLQDYRMAILLAAKDYLAKDFYDNLCYAAYQGGDIRFEQLPIYLQNEFSFEIRKKRVKQKIKSIFKRIAERVFN